MALDNLLEGPDLKEMAEEELWDLINDNRNRICMDVRPCILIPYLRQARVLTELDEDEILSCHNLNNRCMRTSHMLDLLRTQGRNGAVALLESLMIHYPVLYTKATGRKPSTEPSRLSGLIKYSELTEYLVRAVTGMQKELQDARSEARLFGDRCVLLESEISQIMEQEEKSRCLASENQRLQRLLDSLQREVAKMKEEKCDVYIRYTAAIEEKAAVNQRLHELNLQVYQLQTELQSVQTENEFQKQRSLRSVAATPQLKEELRSLRNQLAKVEKLDPARQDILAQDLAEAIDSQGELAQQLRCYREENEQLLRDKQGLSDQKEGLSLQVQQLSLECKMQQQKSTVIQNQMRDLQAERDQAYVSRDEAQAMNARILAEKDTLRCQLMELQERVFALQAKRSSRDQQRSSDEPNVHWESPQSSCEESSIPARRTLRRMDALNPLSMATCRSEYEDPVASSLRSHNAEPPSPESIRRRREVLYQDDSTETPHDVVLDDFVLLPSVRDGDKQTPRLSSSARDSSSYGLSRTCAPPFLMRSRPKAIRESGRVLSISVQGDSLLSQLAVVGGNKTGVFVHQVTEGSAAHTVGISPGAQIVELKYEQNQKALRMVLEDSTLEEAMWALGQVTGLCHLSLRPKPVEYEALLQKLQSNKMSSGDSFYVRVNMSLACGPSGTLNVSCNDILHVTSTRPAGTEDVWHACQVHPCQLLDLQSGTVPNYYRAQRLLIRIIEDISFQTKKSQKAERAEDQSKEKAVRIVSTGRQGRNPLWVSVDEGQSKSTESGDSSAPKSCVTLMPYTLVTPHYPPTCRPVLLLPSVLGRHLDKKLADWQGFQLPEAEVLSPSEHAVRLQKSEILEECEQGRNCCYTLQSVEKVMNKGIHCVLPLGLDCVRRLHRFHIFPIIIFVGQTARSARKLRSKLQRHGHAELMACCRSEEPLLDKLPCLYHSVAPDSWCDQSSLLTSLRTVIWEEQKKIVWLETDLW